MPTKPHQHSKQLQTFVFPQLTKSMERDTKEMVYFLRKKYPGELFLYPVNIREHASKKVFTIIHEVSANSARKKQIAEHMELLGGALVST